MSISIKNLKLNNKEVTSNSVLVPLDVVTLNWEYESSSIAIKQSAYEIRIAKNNISWGTSSFVADVISQPYAKDAAQYWRMKNKFLQRGITYYGQLRIKDSLDNESDWVKFKITVNRLPFITAAEITPTQPTENTDLVLEYTQSSDAVTNKIKWFRNGKYNSQFDNYTKISREYLRYNDVWYCEITPYDGTEYGATFFVKSVTITKKAPVSSNLQVLPLNPNINDILEANFATNDGVTSHLLTRDQSKISWFINDQHIENADNQKYVRFDLKPEDKVYFTVTPFDGITYGETVSSAEVLIQDAGFRIINLLIDGTTENLSVKGVNPTIEWDVIQPYDRSNRYAKVKIGTAPGAENVYEGIVETYDNKFVVPNNLIRRGFDYYVAVAVSDTQDNFNNFETSRFRVVGNLWDTEVDNETGWTAEFALRVEGEKSYQRVSLADGARFAEIRFYVDSVQLFLGAGSVIKYALDTTVTRNYLVIGKLNTIKIYADNAIILDGTDMLLQESAQRFIEIGTDGNSDATGYLKRFVYNVDGYFEPGDSNYASIRLERFVNLSDMSVADIAQNDGDVIVAANPINEQLSGQIYKIKETTNTIVAATENADSFDMRVNSFGLSPDEDVFQISHSYGSTIFNNYFIPKYDSDSVFVAGFDPTTNLWELVKTAPFNAISYINEGLVIDTTVGARQSILSNTPTEIFITTDTEAITFASLYDSIFSYNFDIELSGDYLYIYLHDTNTEAYVTSLSNKTVNELIDELNGLTTSDNYFFSLFYEVYINNSSIGSQAANRLFDVSRVNIFPSYTISGSYEIIDVYNASPYGTLNTGKWFYTHRKKGTAWFDRVSNDVGWTVDFDFRVDQVEDSDTPAFTGTPKGIGVYFNDGVVAENLYFMPQEIIFETSNKSYLYDTTELSSYRIVGKKNKVKLFGKKSNEQAYTLIAESGLQEIATKQGNAGRPNIALDSSGILHAVWHDDGAGVNKRQIFYSSFDATTNQWSEPDAIVSDAFSSSNPQIAIDSDGLVYVVYETTKADYTDISVITKNEIGWSDPYLISSGLYDSFNPKIVIDARNNAHVVWEDYRLSQPQIFYIRRNASNGQWSSDLFGSIAVQVTKESVAAKRPALTANNNSLYLTWTSYDRNGNSAIKLTVFDEGAQNWNSSGQNGVDYLVSGLEAIKADNSTICVDLKGQIIVVWQDVVENNLQLFGRFINSRLVFSKNITQLTTGDYDSSHPDIGLDAATGDMYVVFEKQQEVISTPTVDPYDTYGVRGSEVSFKSPSIYLLKFDVATQTWYSSNQNRPSGYTNSFDVEFAYALPRMSYRPTIPAKFNGYLHILFESTETTQSGEVIENKNLFTQIRDIVYDFSFVPAYDVLLHDTYGTGELRLDGSYNRKELRFGDFSDSISSRLVIGGIRYYLSDAVEPFKINLVSSTTTNMVDAEVFCSLPNNKGDAWIGTSKGLVFYESNSNSAYILDNTDYGLTDLQIKAIAFDRKANMYVIGYSATTGLSSIYASNDHAYFFKLDGKVPANAVSLDIDNFNNLYVASKQGLYIIKLDNIYSQLFVNKDNVATARTITIADTDVSIANTTSGLPTNKLTVVKVDAANVAWVGSDNGLIRYASGDITVFTQSNGLLSNKINDISIRNTAIRYIATTAGVNKMLGIAISGLSFDNTNAPPAAAKQTKRGDIKMPVFINAKAVRWKNPNILYIASNYNLYQITFVEESFSTERVEITKFNSSDFALQNVNHYRNDDLRTFRLIGVDDITIPNNVLYEVELNGNKITRGFTFSPKNKIIRFEYPLFETDIVKINIRFDVENLGNFAQNKAEQIAVGNKAARLERVLTAKSNIFASTGGDVNTLQINDAVSDLPFDKIILDRKPPTGKISIGNRRERTVFEVKVDPAATDPYGLFDEVSGIDKMVVSNFTNFTSDGETEIEPIVFTRFLLHNIGDIFDSVTKQYTFASGKGRRLLSYQPVGGNITFMAGTAEPANIYKYDNQTQTWSLFDKLEVVGGVSDPSASVEFIIAYNDRIYVGTGSPSGVGKIWILNTNTNKFDLFRTLPGNTHAYCALVYDDVLYFGGGGGSYGALYSYDGVTSKEIFTGISGAVFSLVESNGELYAGTGAEGRVYKLDVKNQTQQIVDVNADRNCISIDKALVNGTEFVFSGYSSNGQIKRSRTPDGVFIHSFKTVPSSVYSLRNIDGTLYAAIGNSVYYLDNVWTNKYTHRENVRDIVAGDGGSVWFVSDSYIYKIAQIDNIKRVYLKLIDKAGNETALYTDAAQTALNEDLFAEISLSNLSEFINQNRILKVDEFGNATSLREGNDRFYSADIIEEEKGEYYSEIFNGSNNFVSWDKILWDASIPENTSMEIQVRTANTRDAVMDADFSYAVDGKDASADVSFLSGQFLQFKIILRSMVRGLSPTVKNVVVRMVSSDSTHFFTTNFVLPSRLKGGILTSTKLLPVSAEVVFGINTSDSTNFSEYQIIDENRVFTTDEIQNGSNMRVGIRFITPTKSEASDYVPEYSPYGEAAMLNSLEWNYTNDSGSSVLYNFKVSFYEDSSLNTLIYSASSADSYVGFSADGDIFPTGGIYINSGKSATLSFTPVGETPLRCNTIYYIKIESLSTLGDEVVLDNNIFYQTCATTFVDTISFDFVNTTTVSEDYHFRIRFYNNSERTDLKYTAFSGNDTSNWFVGSSPISVYGALVEAGETVNVTFTPSLSYIDPNKTYYLSVDIYDGTKFENNSNSFTFKANEVSSQIYCGDYADVPVVKNFAIMFELENNEFISMRVKV